MSGQFVYHVVTEKPMCIGQTIRLDQTHPNGVCRRVLAFQRLQNGEALQDDTAELIRADMDKWAKVAYRELALEAVRAAEFPSYPSRLYCLYTSRSLEEARKWARFFKEIGRTVFAIAKLRVNGNLFDGDACNCFDGTQLEEDNLEKARRYWKMDAANEQPVMETLVDGEITVVDLLPVE